jgi:hypothetical protein
VASGVDTVVVSSTSALQAALDAAPPGRQILVAPGTYAAASITWNNNGTEINPIVVRPQNGLGTVTFNSPSWAFNLASSHMVMSGFYFTEAHIELRGNFNRISRCRFRQINGQTIFIANCKDSRVDHCDFSDYVSGTGTKVPIWISNGSVGSGASARLLIDYNYFHDISSSGGLSNPILAPNASSSNACIAMSGIVIDHCLFENIVREGSAQDIDIKTSNVTVRFCTFAGGGSSYLQTRKGNFCELRSNWFENVNSHPLKVFGEGHLIIGNRCVGGTLWVCSGNEPSLNCTSGGYAPAVDCRIVGNIVDNDIDVGRLYSDLTKSADAVGNILEGNMAGNIDLTTDASWHSGTVVNPTTSEQYVAAVKLTAADVGLAAGDPLCD